MVSILKILSLKLSKLFRNNRKPKLMIMWQLNIFSDKHKNSKFLFRKFFFAWKTFFPLSFVTNTKQNDWWLKKWFTSKESIVNLKKKIYKIIWTNVLLKIWFPHRHSWLKALDKWLTVEESIWTQKVDCFNSNKSKMNGDEFFVQQNATTCLSLTVFFKRQRHRTTVSLTKCFFLISSSKF